MSSPWAANLLATLSSTVYPPICAICLRQQSGTYGWCRDCAAQLPMVHGATCRGCGIELDGVLKLCLDCISQERPWQDAVTVLSYGGMARDIIHRFKYQGDTALARGLGEVAASAWSERRHDTESPCAIIPVPLHWLRYMQRGYNQAEMLGRELSRHTGIPCWNALIRHRYTRSQARLNLKQRLRNLNTAFTVNPSFDFVGKRVLLCDDVMTTGATLRACADRVIGAGASTVEVLTIARG